MSSKIRREIRLTLEAFEEIVRKFRSLVVGILTILESMTVDEQMEHN